MKKTLHLFLPLLLMAVALFSGCGEEDGKNSSRHNNIVLSRSHSYQPGSGYELVWNDEFESGSEAAPIDESKWSYSLGVGGAQDGNESGDKYWGNDEWQAYTDRLDNVFLKDCKLHLRAIKERYHNTYHGQDVMVDFTSGKIHTHNKFHFRYGKIVAKVKLPNMGGKLLDPVAQQTDAVLKSGKGVWPAFWMLGANQKANDQFPGAETKTWPACGELDIIEGSFVNTGNWVVSSTTHWHDPTVDWYPGVVGIWGIPDHMQWPDDEFYWFENDEGTRGRIHGDGYFNNFVDWDNHAALDPSTGKNVKPFYEDFYIFEFEWGIEEDGMKKMYWYIMEEDGSNKRKIFDMAYDPVNGHQEEFAEHFYLVFNLAIGGEGTGFGRKSSSINDIFLDTVGERDELVVDWVRVYQKSDMKDYWGADRDPEVIISGPVTVEAGKTIDLSATTTGSDTEESIYYTWSSDDEEVATIQGISDDGGSNARLSGLKPGTVTIRAENTTGNVESSVEITVTDPDDDDDDDDGEIEPEKVTITTVGDGDVMFSIRLPERKEQVHLFARKNGVQDYVIIDLHL
ncbi:MAG: Ig-like domain-containing protein, partial [Spirochaetota bacterium]